MRVYFGLSVGLAMLASVAAAQTPAASAPPSAAPPVAGQAQGQGGRGRMMDPPPGGMPYVHDPSTVIRSNGMYYVYATGRGAPFLSSPDGVTWTRQGSVFPAVPEDVHARVPKNNGTDIWAPDIIKVGDTFFLYYAVSSWGSFVSAVALATNKTLDPKDPAYKWVSKGVVVASDGNDDMNAIDPGVMLAPDGTMWLCYGSYHGSIKVVQLNPKTGLTKDGKAQGSAIATAKDSEASDIIFHDGYFYLFVNHGSCCQGKTSQYNIRVGRSKQAVGPYLDKHGMPMLQGGGSMFLAAHDRRIGPGHFGRVIEAKEDEDGAERFSLHYEADLTNGGRSSLGIRPLLWSVDGWPIAGDNLAEGVYQIVAAASENTLLVHVPMSPAPSRPSSVPLADAPPPPPQVPIGPPELRIDRYLAVENERWTIAPAGGGFYRIVNVGTVTALSADGEAVALAAFTGADGQLWRMEQFPDGGWRIINKASGKSLAPQGREVATGAFVADDAHKWMITTP